MPSQASAAESTEGKSRQQQQQQQLDRGQRAGSSSNFFLPPLDIASAQRGSSAGQRSGSGLGLPAGRAQYAALTPPPSPAPAAGPSRAAAGHDAAGHAGSAQGQPGTAAAAEARASHSGGGPARHSAPGGGGAVTVFDRKVYVSVYADGPTKVLCFSDDPLWTGSSEADEGGDALQLLTRLHQVARQLMTVDRQLELYQGAAYGLKPARASRAVPALLLLQHQQLAAGGLLARRGSMISGGGDASAQRQLQQQQQELPVLLQGTIAAAAGAGSTATAALALLQQMGRTTGTQQQHAHATERGSLAAMGMRSSEVSTDAASWPAAALGGHAYAAGVEVPAGFAQQYGQNGEGPAARLLSVSPHTVVTQSHISARPLAGAAAAAAAGVRVTGGLLGAEGGLDGGVKLYYDKLTLLLDSQLPLGGNVKVGSRSIASTTTITLRGRAPTSQITGTQLKQKN